MKFQKMNFQEIQYLDHSKYGASLAKENKRNHHHYVSNYQVRKEGRGIFSYLTENLKYNTNVVK